ncbi:MAG: YidH family protein [Dehalococcoidia bacterium]
MQSAAPWSQHVTEHLANERTFLAWVRTGIGFIALGFVVSRFGLYLRELARSANRTVPGTRDSAVIGVLLVAFGLALATAALVRYRAAQRQIEQGRYRPSQWMDIVLVVCVVGGGVAMLVVLR